MRIKHFSITKLKEYLRDEDIDYEKHEYPNRIPTPSQAIRLETFREMGCDVDYTEPDWVKEEKSKNTVFSTFRNKVTLEEKIAQIRTPKIKKEILTKKIELFRKNK